MIDILIRSGKVLLTHFGSWCMKHLERSGNNRFNILDSSILFRTKKCQCTAAAFWMRHWTSLVVKQSFYSWLLTSQNIQFRDWNLHQSSKQRQKSPMKCVRYLLAHEVFLKSPVWHWNNNWSMSMINLALLSRVEVLNQFWKKLKMMSWQK